MSRRRRRFRRRVSLVVAVLTTLVLAAALLMGGGASWPGEQLLAMGGLLLIIMALARVSVSEVRPERFLYFWLLPLALVAVPLLQLIPLPEWLWSHLPGRDALLASMGVAGAEKTGWAPVSLVPLETERLLYTVLVPIGIFMAAVTMRGGQRRKLVAVCLSLAVVNIFLGFWQVVEGAGSALYFYDITNPGGPVGLFANRNHLATMMLVSIPIAAGLLADRVRHHRRSVTDWWVWLGVALLVIFTVGATSTGSRTGLLLVLPAIAAGGLAFQWAARGGMPRRGAGMFVLGVLIAIAMIVQLTLYTQLDRLIAERLDEFRLDMWTRTVEVSVPAAGTGYGIGSFTHAYDDVGEAAADYPVYVNHAHNDYLELWLEGGLPVAILMAGALILTVGAIRKKLKPPEAGHDDDTHHRGLQIGAGAGLLLLAMHSAADYPLRTLAIASYAALLAAILVGTVRVTTRH